MVMVATRSDRGSDLSNTTEWGIAVDRALWGEQVNHRSDRVRARCVWNPVPEAELH